MIGRINLLLMGAITVIFWSAFYSWKTGDWHAYVSKLSPEVALIPIAMNTPWGGVDRCPTCHRTNVERELGSPQKEGVRHAPTKISQHRHQEHHSIGCTACHGGQGRRLDLRAHEPEFGMGLMPFIRSPLIEARCGRCHVPGSVKGDSNLVEGIHEYMDSGCAGCHQPGRTEPGLGPDLRLIGRRTLKELTQSILTPRAQLNTAKMWSYDWKYRESEPDEKHRIMQLITALLAFSEGSHVSFSTPPTQGMARYQAGQACNHCHLRVGSGSADPQAFHRCIYLKNNASLKCSSCHPVESGIIQQISSRDKDCPQIAAARSNCMLCHFQNQR